MVPRAIKGAKGAFSVFTDLFFNFTIKKYRAQKIELAKNAGKHQIPDARAHEGLYFMSPQPSPILEMRLTR